MSMDLYKLWFFSSYKYNARRIKLVKKLTPYECYARRYLAGDVLPSDSETLVYQDELFWLHNKKTVIFIPDKKTVDLLLGSTFMLGDVEAINLPYNSVQVSLPRNYEYKGYGLKSFLATKSNSPIFREKYICEPFFDKVAIENPNLLLQDNQSVITICNYGCGARSNSVQRCTYVEEQIKDVMHASTLKSLSKIRVQINKSNYLRKKCGTSKDGVAQILYPRLLYSALIYSQGMPETLREGIPEFKIRNNTHGVLKSKTLDIPFPEKEYKYNEVPTLVYPHSRQLMHDKFYRGEYSSMKKGSRIIIIPAFWRHSKPECLTLEAANDSDFSEFNLKEKK